MLGNLAEVDKFSMIADTPAIQQLSCTRDHQIIYHDKKTNNDVSTIIYL